MNEGQYLELVNQLQEKFKSNEKLTNKVLEQCVRLKKHIMVAYSLTKIIDDATFINFDDYKVFIEILRGYLSTCLDEEVLCLNCVNCNGQEPPSSEPDED